MRMTLEVSHEPEELLSLSMLARSRRRIVLRRKALRRAGTRREYSARSTPLHMRVARARRRGPLAPGVPGSGRISSC